MNWLNPKIRRIFQKLGGVEAKLLIAAFYRRWRQIPAVIAKNSRPPALKMKDEANVLKLFDMKTLIAKIGQILQKLAGVEAKLSNLFILNRLKAYFGARMRKSRGILSLNCGRAPIGKKVFKTKPRSVLFSTNRSNVRRKQSHVRKWTLARGGV